MANRSYLYGHKEGATPEHRDLGEWRTNVPLSHLLLVGTDPTPVASAIWSVEEKIALSGDAARGRELMAAFLDWLEPQMTAHAEEFARKKEEVLELLGRRQDDRFHLELGEIFQLGGYELSEMESETQYYARNAASLVQDVERLLDTPGSTVADANDWLVKEATDMHESLGLSFLGILYFHLGEVAS